MDGKILDVIGENFNTSRRIKATSPRVIKDGDMVKLSYVNLKGETDFLDVTSIYPEDPDQVKKTQLTHVAQAMHTKNMDYIEWLIIRQIEAGANIIDICVDEICVDEEERHEWMRWIIPVVQKMADVTFAIDSSDPITITAGLEVYDCTKSQPAINSVNLERGREVLIPLAKKYVKDKAARKQRSLDRAKRKREYRKTKSYKRLIAKLNMSKNKTKKR